MFLGTLDNKLGFEGAELAYLVKPFKGLAPFQQALFRVRSPLRFMSESSILSCRNSFSSRIAFICEYFKARLCVTNLSVYLGARVLDL